MSKRDKLLSKQNETEHYDLSEDEQQEMLSIITLYEQAAVAHSTLLTGLANRIADRHEVDRSSRIDLNMAEVLERGVQAAKLIVKRMN